MKQFSALIKSFFYQPVPPQTLALLRIFVSGFALLQFFVLLPDWMWIYGPEGLLPWSVSEPLSTTNFPSLGSVERWLAPIKLSSNAVIYLVTSIYFFSLVGLLLGYKTRLMGMLAWFTHGIVNTTGHLTAYGVETFTHIALFYCMVLPVGICWSLDSLKKPAEIAGYLVTLSLRVIQVHLCIMYFSCGIEKGLGTQWWNGEAIWIAMQQDQFHKVDINWMAEVPWVPTALCIGTLVIETLYPLGMLFKKTRRFWLLSIIGMHLFIGIFLGLQLFALLMILLNVAVFGQHCFSGMFTRGFFHGLLRNDLRESGISAADIEARRGGSFIARVTKAS